MLLDEVVATSASVARSPGRKAKISAIASLLARVPPGEVAIAVAFLSGDLTQRQIGVGYAALIDLTRSEPGQVAPDDIAAASEPVLTLTETDAAFEAIGALLGPGSQAQRRAQLAALISRATDSERQFLFRLIAGDLRQGALEGVMTEAVALAAEVPAPEVRRAAQLRGSLRQVAVAALGAVSGGADRDGVIAVLRGFTLKVGQPVRPMLAASAPDVEAALSKIGAGRSADPAAGPGAGPAAGPAALDWKIDGIRVQIHRDGDRVWVYTRTLDDITDRVPELVAIARALDVRSALIDAEAIALRQDRRPHPFQVTSARVASQSGPGTSAEPAGRVPLTAFLFDLLHIDGHDLIDQPAAERFSQLAAIAPGELLIPRIVTGDPAEAAEFFADAIGRGHEGVVVKAVDAPYRTGRRGSDWIKVKPRTTLDLVILAAEWGHGRRTGLLSNLHLGARDPETGRFVMLGKTFKGLTDAMLRWQTDHLLSIADPPGQDKTAAAHGVVRVRPELVAEIAFDGVQASKRYPGGVTLRFARVLRYRTDKSASEADTIETVRSLWPAPAEGTAEIPAETPPRPPLRSRPPARPLERARDFGGFGDRLDIGEQGGRQQPGVLEHVQPGKLGLAVPAERVSRVGQRLGDAGDRDVEMVNMEVRLRHVVVAVDRLLQDPPRRADDLARGDDLIGRGHSRRGHEIDREASLLGNLAASGLWRCLVILDVATGDHQLAEEGVQDKPQPPLAVELAEDEGAGGRMLDAHHAIVHQGGGGLAREARPGLRDHETWRDLKSSSGDSSARLFPRLPALARRLPGSGTETSRLWHGELSLRGALSAHRAVNAPCCDKSPR